MAIYKRNKIVVGIIGIVLLFACQTGGDGSVFSTAPPCQYK